MSLNVIGLNQAIRFNRRLAKSPETQQMMEDIVKDTVSLMRRYAAVDTGEMMESIRYEKVSETEFRIIIDVPWAIYQEYGTMYMDVGTPESPKGITSTSGKPAFRPFARPAVWLINKEFPSYIRKLFISFRK